MQTSIVRMQGADSALGRALGRDLKGKLSPVLYLVGMSVAFASPLAAYALYAGLAALWLVPDRRVEAALPKATLDS